MKRPVTFQNVQQLIRKAAELTGDFSAEDILGTCRKNELVEARAAISVILFDEGFGLTRIGRMINRDHSTIATHLRNHHFRHKREVTYACVYDILQRYFANLLKDIPVQVLAFGRPA